MGAAEEPGRVALLAATPTPLQLAPRLSAALDVEVWLKRDDLTGFGLGGNKTRGLEFLVADAARSGCDCLVTGAGPQSNWAFLAALAARVHGLEPTLVYYGDPVAPAGNLRLATLIGADIRFTGDPARESVDAALDDVAEQLRARGRRPYVVPRGGATPHGALGYVRGAAELSAQLADHGLNPAEVWVATGSCGTQAGLVAGAAPAGLVATISGVTVSRPASECRQRIADLAAGAAALAGAEPTSDEAVVVVDGYVGPGYGAASADGQRAARLVAHTEGIFLDPVFGAKAMAALIDHAEAGQLAGPTVFVVTGGAPTLFVAAITDEAGNPAAEPLA